MYIGVDYKVLYKVDTFDREDSDVSLGKGDTGEVWTPGLGIWGILSGCAYPANAAVPSVATVDSGMANGSVSVKISDWAYAAGAAPGLIFRYSDNSNYFRIVRPEGTNTLTLIKREAGSLTSLQTTACVFHATDVLKVTFNGDAISYYLNDILINATTSDFNNTATKHGIGTAENNINVRWDDFIIQAI